MSDYIERRRNLWYAVLTIPEDVRPALGKLRFVQSLGTSDKHRAKVIAAPVLAGWRALIRQERGEGDAVTTEALRWRLAIANEERSFVPKFEDEQPVVEGLVTDRAAQLEIKHGYKAAKRFADIAFGVTEPTTTHFEPWLAAQAHLAQKTRDQMRNDVALLVKRFPTIGEITHQSVKRWLDELTVKQVSPSSQKRLVSFCRSYWRHLRSIDAVPSDLQPFNNLVGKGNKQRGAADDDSWVPFAPEEVVKLYRMALTEKDAPLAALIMLAAYTGARIEELCALKLVDVGATSFKIVGAKTNAGIREVPLHSHIRPLVAHLRAASKDGYLLTALTSNKYGKRSNAIGKRFGRLKTAQGFGKQHVFHSIRKTLVTLLEDAGVLENITADIVGHKKPTMTYGIYSGGNSLKTKAAALERIEYPKMPIP